MRLPLHIVQQLTVTKGRDKAFLVADLVFSLEERFIEFEQSPTFDNGIVIRAYGEQIGAIDVTRGKQDFKLTGDTQWSTEWWLLVDLLKIKSDRILDEMAEQAQSDYEDATDASLTDDERDFIREFGDLADNILSQIGRTDCLELVKDDNGEFRICDEERDGTPIIWTRPDTRLWGTSVFSWGQLTANPLEHLTHYVSNIS